MRSENLDVFDFDGTLINVNSFKEINKKLLLRLFCKIKLMYFMKLSFWYLIRKAGIISHLDFKKKAVDVFENSLLEDEKKELVQNVVDLNLNLEVYEALRLSDNCIISTSAPHSYISRMKIKSDAIIISSLEPGDTYPDQANFGHGKIDNIKAYFKGHGISVLNTYTDSEDDRPLIDYSENAFFVQNGKMTKIK